jgi:RimJ/RimL family protein N-acetyltransferase
MNIELLHQKLRSLRSENRFDEAFELAKHSLAAFPQYRHVVSEHNPIFWQNMRAGICDLKRRNSQDIEFVRSLWANEGFIYNFHRLAPLLPEADTKLANILEAEYLSTFSEANAIHWVVRDKHQEPWGLMSLTEVYWAHQRAELLIGVLPNAPLGLATAAMLLLFQFYFKVMNFNKLVSLVYEDNAHSVKGAMHLGFKLEGNLKHHLRDPKTGLFVTIQQLGLFAEDAFSSRNTALGKRLLGVRK